MNRTNTLPAPVLKALRAETAGENISWAAQPNPWRCLVAASPIWLFAVPWTVFSLGMMGMMLAGPVSGKPPPDSLNGMGFYAMYGGVLFMVPFVAVGVLMMAAPIWIYLTSFRTVYAITGKRLLIVTAGRQLQVKQFDPKFITRFERTEARDGSGSLKMFLGSRKDSDGDTVETQESLSYVANVKKAEQLLQHIRQRDTV